MAKQGKKQRKFDRNRKSKRNMYYVSVHMDRINKIKKLKRHLSDHPEDVRAASALKTLERNIHSTVAGEFQGPVPSFRPTTITPVPPEMRAAANNDVQEEFRLHIKKGKETVLLENVATREHYEVRDGRIGVTLFVSLFYSEAFQFFEERRGACKLLKRMGKVSFVLKNKDAAPPKGFESQVRAEALAIIKERRNEAQKQTKAA